MDSATEKRGLVADVQNRFNLALTASVLLPSALAAYAAALHLSDTFNKTVLVFYAIPAGLVADYICECIKKTLSEKKLWWIGVILLIQIGSFVAPVYMLASGKNDSVTFIQISPYIISLAGTIVIPLFLFFFFAWETSSRQIKMICSDSKDFLQHLKKQRR